MAKPFSFENGRPNKTQFVLGRRAYKMWLTTFYPFPNDNEEITYTRPSRVGYRKRGEGHDEQLNIGDVPMKCG